MRVHELAKELGLSSKDLLAVLGEMAFEQSCLAADAGLVGAGTHRRVRVKAQAIERLCRLASELPLDTIETQRIPRRDEAAVPA